MGPVFYYFVLSGCWVSGCRFVWVLFCPTCRVSGFQTVDKSICHVLICRVMFCRVAKSGKASVCSVEQSVRSQQYGSAWCSLMQCMQYGAVCIVL